MATNNNTQIKVKETTKLRLDLLKNSRTYDAVISDMLLYFETTGITPQSKIVSPAVAVKEQASRVIEVVRGIEKVTNTKLKNIEQMVSRLFPMQPDTENLHNSDEFMHLSQVQELLERAKEQEKALSHYREQVQGLQTELESVRRHPDNGQGVNVRKLLEVVERIDGMKKVQTFNDAAYEIDRNTFDLWIKRLKEELKA